MEEWKRDWDGGGEDIQLPESCHPLIQSSPHGLEPPVQDNLGVLDRNLTDGPE